MPGKIGRSPSGRLSSRLALFLIAGILLGNCTAADYVLDSDPGSSSTQIVQTEDAPVPILLTATPNANNVPQDSGQLPARLAIVQFGNMTNSGSEFTLPYIRGAEDRVRQMNLEGRQQMVRLELTTHDTQGLADNLTRLWDEVVLDSEAAFVLVWDAERIDQLISRIEGWDGIVIVPYADRDLLNESGLANLYSLSTPSDIELLFMISYLQENWNRIQPPSARDEIKLAYFSWPNRFGAAALTDSARDALQALGVEVVYEATIQYSYTENVEPLIRAAVRAEANVIFVQGFAHAPAIVLNELHRQGLQDQFLVMGPSQALDISVYGYLASPSFFEGFMAPSGMAWWSDEQNTGIESALELHRSANRASTDMGRGWLTGVLGIDLIAEIADQALSQSSGTNLESMDFSSLMSQVEMSTADGHLANLEISVMRRYPLWLRIREVRGFNEFVPITPYAIAPGLP